AHATAVTGGAADGPRCHTPRAESLAMGMLAWVMMGLALWHFTIWLPDRYWGGIVGAFIGALVGAVLFGLIVNGFHIPGRHATHIASALAAISVQMIGLTQIIVEGT